MPEVTLKPTDLPEGHPALTPDGYFTERALQLLNSRYLPSRVAPGESPAMHVSGDPVRNTELFYRIADEIEVFPEEYNQAVWGDDDEDYKNTTPCGTSFCIAGHAGHLTNWQPEQGYAGRLDWGILTKPRSEIKDKFAAIDVGRVELGLTSSEADFLFDENWKPDVGLTVPQALRMIGDGAALVEATSQDYTEAHWEGDDVPYHLQETRKSTGLKPIYT